MSPGKTALLRTIIWSLIILLLSAQVNSVLAADLKDIKDRGVLRHLGIPYAHFVTESGEGFDTELVKLFAQYLGVKYQYVEATWDSEIGDLTGKRVKPKGNDVTIVGEAPIRGDIIANGFTILNWRKKIVDFSEPTFPNQIWLVAKADSSLQPITPHDDVDKDIASVRSLLKGHALLGKAGTCLDPILYDLKKTGARLIMFPGPLNGLVPAVIQGKAELTLLDVPDALVALDKFPGKIKIIGPITEWQAMGCAFAKDAPELREAFNRFLLEAKADGTYLNLVQRYYPKILVYYHDFFGGE